MDEQQQWYVTIAGNAVGPVSTDLVLRGIKHKKIATEAYVCVVGASEWQALADVPEFHGALEENGLLPLTADTNQPGDRALSELPGSGAHALDALSGAEEDEFETTAQFAMPASQREPEQAALDDTQAQTDAGATELPLPGEPRNGKHSTALETQGQTGGLDFDIDVHIAVDETEAPTIEWNHGFADYFLVDADVTLPDEQLLLRSLATTSHDTFLHDEPMWNLALCLAFGSNAVASVAADVFFDVVATHGQYERIEWMARTLLSRGFMPSGIPHAAGNQGIGRLRQACPDELRMQLESQLGL
jgi:hypothetical protein